MKKLVNSRCYVAIGTNEYEDTSIWNYIHYVDADKCKITECTFGTFEDAFTAVTANYIRNARVSTTLFSKKPTIKIGWSNLERGETTINTKTFKPIRVKWEYQDVTKIYTIKELADILPAEEFCEWLKDRGIAMVDLM